MSLHNLGNLWNTGHHLHCPRVLNLCKRFLLDNATKLGPHKALLSDLSYDELRAWLEDSDIRAHVAARAMLEAIAVWIEADTAGEATERRVDRFKDLLALVDLRHISAGSLFVFRYGGHAILRDDDAW